jgi:hypothetical protein
MTTYRPLTAPFPFPDLPLRAPLPLLSFFKVPLTAPLPLTSFSARSAPFSAPLNPSSSPKTRVSSLKIRFRFSSLKDRILSPKSQWSFKYEDLKSSPSLAQVGVICNLFTMCRSSFSLISNAQLHDVVQWRQSGLKTEGILGSRPSPSLRKRPETTPSTTPPPLQNLGGHDPQPPRIDATDVVAIVVEHPLYIMHAVIEYTSSSMEIKATGGRKNGHPST